jgi:hypothetical protein
LLCLSPLVIAPKPRRGTLNNTGGLTREASIAWDNARRALIHPEKQAPCVSPYIASLRETPSGVVQVEEVNDSDTVAVKVVEHAPTILALRVRVQHCGIKPREALQRQHTPDSRHNLIVRLIHAPYFGRGPADHPHAVELEGRNEITHLVIP